jgi:hypothetical protein
MTTTLSLSAGSATHPSPGLAEEVGLGHFG